MLGEQADRHGDKKALPWYVRGGSLLKLPNQDRGVEAAEGSLAAAQAGPLLPTQSRDFPDTRPICFDFQRGNCARGAKCKFSHGDAWKVEHAARIAANSDCEHRRPSVLSREGDPLAIMDRYTGGPAKVSLDGLEKSARQDSLKQPKLSKIKKRKKKDKRSKKRRRPDAEDSDSTRAEERRNKQLTQLRRERVEREQAERRRAAALIRATHPEIFADRTSTSPSGNVDDGTTRPSAEFMQHRRRQKARRQQFGRGRINDALRNT